MILILSEKFDPSTNDIIDWLRFFNVPFLRINYNDSYAISYKACITSEESSESIIIDNQEYQLEDFSAFWYRRGGLPGYREINDFTISEDTISDAELKKNIKEEDYALRHFFYAVLEKNVRRIGASKTDTLNKLKTLHLAKKSGLKVPKTIITGDKNELEKFRESCNHGIITKAIHEGVLFYDKSDRGYMSYVEEIDDRVFSQIPATFHASKFQEKLDKWIELRVFFLIDKFYSMAIFSQLDDQTSVDFRVYNEEKPNRNVPFNLPEKIEHSLLTLMKELNLETASIDIILTKKMEYIFLEANPVGQFGMTSTPCNYKLEKKIAEYLCYGE